MRKKNKRSLTFSLLVDLTDKHTVNLLYELTRQFDVHVLLSHPETRRDTPSQTGPEDMSMRTDYSTESGSDLVTPSLM